MKSLIIIYIYICQEKMTIPKIWWTICSTTAVKFLYKLGSSSELSAISFVEELEKRVTCDENQSCNFKIFNTNFTFWHIPGMGEGQMLLSFILHYTLFGKERILQTNPVNKAVLWVSG